MPDQKNMWLAVGLSLAILLGFELLYNAPRRAALEAEQRAIAEAQAEAQTAAQAQALAEGVTAGSTALPDAPAGAPPGVTVPGALSFQVLKSRESALADGGERITITTPEFSGSVALRGARFDDLMLLNYREKLPADSPAINLLSPDGGPRPYYANFGWIGADPAALPQQDTVWSVAEGREITNRGGVTLRWDNGAGLLFQKALSVDDGFLFAIDQSVSNTTDTALKLYPYGLLSRTGTPPSSNNWIVHEGPYGVFDQTLTEWSYSGLADEGAVELSSTGGWLGITDKYWMAALVPRPDDTIAARMLHTPGLPGQESYQLDYRGSAVVIQPGETVTVRSHLFAGAKRQGWLADYMANPGVDNFELAIDYGWFYFLTKPMLSALIFFGELTGNYGVAIILLTLVIRILLFPFAHISYKALTRMKKMAPEMQRLKEKYGDDRAGMQKEMMEIYRREKINPFAGCLPILMQIPVFFALYKVLFVSIEVRHAPFFGWIEDLSAPDPTSLFNLFGLLPYDVPTFLVLGVWPILMGITMFLQQKMNPPPPDPMQARIFMLLPFVFTFMLASFPAGLVIYWTTNNLLSIAQQYAIMRSMGVPIGGDPPQQSPAKS